jgi:phosphatidate cytidylyltransferase
MNNLITRSLTGAVYVAVIVCSLLLHPIFLVGVLLFFNFQSLLEYRKMAAPLGELSWLWVVINTICLALSLLLAYFESRHSVQFIPLMLLVVYLLIQSVVMKSGHNAHFLMNALAGSMYISLPLMLVGLIHLRSAGLHIPFLLCMFLLIWVNDTFAYLVGIVFGRHKLIPRISPKKSWEGFFGGILFTLVSTLLFHHFYPQIALWKWLVFGLLTAVSSVFGDLAESMLKRAANLKDSGTLLPGHGGVLDRIDSLLLASPVIYSYLLSIGI